MKKTILPFVAVMAAFTFLPCCLSCTTENPENAENTENEVDKPEVPETPTAPGKLKAGDYTLVFPEQSVTEKTGWEAGDAVYIHGNYGPNAKVFVLKAEDIKDGGKTATVNLDESIMEFQYGADGLYAVYPADAVLQGDSLMDTDVTFTSWDKLLMMAYQADGKFSFRPVISALSFVVSGDFDSYIIAANDRSGIRVNGFRADYTSKVQNISHFSTDGHPFIKGEVIADGSSVNRLFFPGGINFKKGFTLFMGKDGEYLKAYVEESAFQIASGEAVSLGDISSNLEDYTGPAPKIPEMGEFTKYQVKFNELSGVCVSPDGTFLWCLGDSGEIAKVSVEGGLLSKAGLRTTTGSSLDSEGITVNYDTGDLVIGCEANVVCRIPQESIADIFAASTFKGVETLFSISDAKSFGNAGLEGITYYKDGLVYCGTQTGSYLYTCNLETGEVLSRKDLRKTFPAITEIAGLSYDPVTDWLWIVDSESHKFFALTGDAENLLGAYQLSSRSNEEGICVDHINSCIWIVDDYGSTSYIYKYDFTGLDPE